MLVTDNRTATAAKTKNRNGAEGVVAVEPEAVFHGWQNAGRECLSGGTQ